MLGDGRTSPSSGLTLALKPGQALLENAEVTLAHGTSALISGESGSGKSTLFRALSGIWPFGQGTACTCRPARAFLAISCRRSLHPDRHAARPAVEVSG